MTRSIGFPLATVAAWGYALGNSVMGWNPALLRSCDVYWTDFNLATVIVAALGLGFSAAWTLATWRW